MTRHRLFWPVLVLMLLLASNLVFTPNFFAIRMQDGHLYGSLIDIVRFGAPLILVALGMTLVIATGGIDPSVGSVVAIGGALACLYISKQEDPNSVGVVLVAVGLSLVVAFALGAWNGVLVARFGVHMHRRPHDQLQRLGSDGNNAGLWIELDAILAVVIGGTALTGGRFHLTGTVLGALIIQTLSTTIYTTGVPPETTLVYKAIVVMIVCLLQSPAFRAKVFGRRPRRQPPAGDASVADAGVEVHA